MTSIPSVNGFPVYAAPMQVEEDTASPSIVDPCEYLSKEGIPPEMIKTVRLHRWGIEMGSEATPALAQEDVETQVAAPQGEVRPH